METQNKLLINHVAKRLPYGLKGILTPQKETVLLTTIFSDNFLMHEVGINYSGAYALTRFKPILFPLSSLTETITIKGESFVPIVELAKLGTREEMCYVTNGNIGTCYVNAEHQKKGFFIYHPNGYFMWQVGKNAEPLTVWYQKLLFEKLLEWHFDVDNLIEKGLAISVFDLTENPYA